MVDAELFEARERPPVVVLLDANVLHPMVLCDLLLRLGLAQVCRVHWSREILAEVVRSIARRRPDLPRERLERRVAAMGDAFPEATIAGYEHLLPALAEFGGDAHVVAAALHGRVDLIVTDNTRDFPEARLSPRGLAASSADDFLCGVWREHPGVVVKVLREQAADTGRPALSVDQIVARLGAPAPRFSALVGAEIRRTGPA